MILPPPFLPPFLPPSSPPLHRYARFLHLAFIYPSPGVPDPFTTSSASLSALDYFSASSSFPQRSWFKRYTLAVPTSTSGRSPSYTATPATSAACAHYTRTHARVRRHATTTDAGAGDGTVTYEASMFKTMEKSGYSSLWHSL